MHTVSFKKATHGFGRGCRVPMNSLSLCSEETVSHYQNNVMEVGTLPVQGKLCTLQPALSIAVWNTVTVSKKATVEEQLGRETIHPAMRAQLHLTLQTQLFVLCHDDCRVGIAQWLKRRTCDRKVAGSDPCRSGAIIFFSRVNFVWWLLFRYPFHPGVTAVACKRPWSFC